MLREHATPEIVACEVPEPEMHLLCSVLHTVQIVEAKKNLYNDILLKIME